MPAEVFTGTACPPCVGADLKAYLDDYERHNDRFATCQFQSNRSGIDPTKLLVAFVAPTFWLSI